MEYLGFFSLLEPHLAEFRQLLHAPDYLMHWQTLVQSTPGAAERMAGMRGLFMRWTRPATA